MSELENEKAIINESPDFETQREIINEEKVAQKKLRKFYIHIGCVFFLIFIIIITAYVTVDLYREYNFFSNDVCLNVNINTDGDDFKNINVAETKACAPDYNIDYFNNRKATFNIDLFGDKSYIFNPVAQNDENGYCKLNCDSNGDNWPDYNIDLNGDKIADINIVKDYVNSNRCDLNCDLNHDTIPDTNIDTNNDGIPDINITDSLNNNKPRYNVDYKGNRKPEFNIQNPDGSIFNPVKEVTPGVYCDLNCDIDGDGWPDYNIKLSDRETLLNQLYQTGNSSVDYNSSKTADWKCFISSILPSCDTNKKTADNEYLNIDVNGDGIPDVNLSSDNGNNITNKVNTKATYNGNSIILNEDYDNNGFPDFNIDINGDGIPDLNITQPGTHTCNKNCDTNYDGIADYLIDYDGKQNNVIGVNNSNLDIDFDGICDVNCDTNYDLYPDLNIDIDGDNIPDINIDTNNDGLADFNIDTDGNHIADSNLSARLDGTCNFNCTDRPETIIDYSESCTTNCDTDKDGWPDTNVDLDYDGICDINCDNKTNNIDNNHDYFIDDNDKTKDLVIDQNNRGTFYVLNPIDITANDIEPGWKDTYVLKVTNNAEYAMAYTIDWQDVINEFTEENNLNYEIVKNGGLFLGEMRTPYQNIVIKDEIYIRPKSTVKYILKIEWRETGENQNIDSGKRFYGKLIITPKN